VCRLLTGSLYSAAWFIVSPQRYISTLAGPLGFDSHLDLQRLVLNTEKTLRCMSIPIRTLIVVRLALQFWIVKRRLGCGVPVLNRRSPSGMDCTKPRFRLRA
jgi:hypothetical protein